MGNTVHKVQTQRVRNGEQVIVQKYVKVQKEDNRERPVKIRRECVSRREIV